MSGVCQVGIQSQALFPVTVGFIPFGDEWQAAGPIWQVAQQGLELRHGAEFLRDVRHGLIVNVQDQVIPGPVEVQQAVCQKVAGNSLYDVLDDDRFVQGVAHPLGLP